MKLMFCQLCNDLVVPGRKDFEVRWCHGMHHAVWWVHGAAGVLRLHCAADPLVGTAEGPMYPSDPRAYVIGLSNTVLWSKESMSAENVQRLIDEHEDSYLFKRWRSLVIRIRPGESGDTGWAPLPA